MYKNKIQKVKISHIISNNIYALKLLWKYCPSKVFYELVKSITYSYYIFATINLYFFRYAVDVAQNGGEYRSVFFALLIVIVIYVLRGFIFSILDVQLLPTIKYKLEKELHGMVIEKSLASELACYENPEFYDKYTRAMAECSGRVEEILLDAVGFFANIIAFFAAASLTVTIDPVLFSFLLLPLVSTIFIAKNNKIDFEKNTVLTEPSRRSAYAIRTFYNSAYAKEMRLTGISVPILSRFKAAVEQSMAINRKYGYKTAVMSFILGELDYMLPSLLYVAWQTLGTGKMTYGSALVATDALYVLWAGLYENTNYTMKFHRNALYIDNLRVFMDYKPLISSNESGLLANGGNISLHNICFAYPGSENKVLRNVSLDIRAGEKIAFVGHNGAGKTTITKLLLRLYDPTSGEITLNGHDIRDYNLTSYRDQFATVLQDYRHFSMSVAQNILMRREREGDAELIMEAIEHSGLRDRVSLMERSIDTTLEKEFDDKGEVLSGGEAQKIAIAHVYASDSPIIILDEPSSALDPIAEYDMYKNMFEACRDRTMVFVSHRLSAATLADRIYVFENGEVVESGNHASLMTANGRYAEMFIMQASNYVTKEGGKRSENE